MALTSHERVLGVGATVAALGIFLAAIGKNDLGGFVTLAGWAALLYGIHRYGRAG